MLLSSGLMERIHSSEGGWQRCLDTFGLKGATDVQVRHVHAELRVDSATHYEALHYAWPEAEGNGQPMWRESFHLVSRYLWEMRET